MKSEIFSVKAEDIKTFLDFDALQSLQKAITTVEEASEQELLVYDQFAEKAATENVHPLVIAYEDNISLNTPMAAFFGSSFLYNFHKYVEVKIDSKSFFNLLDTVWTLRDHKHTILLGTILDSIEILFHFSLDEIMNKEQLIKTGNSLYSVSIELEKLGYFDEALANLHTASSFTQFAEPTHAVDMCRRIIEVARKAGHKDLTLNFFQLAALLCQLSWKDETKRIDAFDATEALFRYMLTKKQSENFEFDKADLEKIEVLIRENEFLKPLVPLFYIGLELADLPEGLPDISALYISVWNNSLPDWTSNVFKGANSLIIDIANKRFELLPKPNNIEVFWSNWSIEYRRMLHSIPHHQSLIREEFRNEILMDLKHELIHVYSLFGSVGTTLNIMRWLLVDLEIMLFVNHYKISEESPLFYSTWDSLLQSRLPVQLTNPDIISLSYVERSVAIECKIQFIEHIWLPWFEGIAVFGETVDDPTLDKEVESPPTSVIKNLVDINVLQEAEEHKISVADVVVEHIKKMEELYSEALKTNGVYRLRTYLINNHKQYLPGYLCVRSILAKWRKTFKKGIRGDQAFRLFLHVTRFSKLDVLPDLSLPIKEFKKEALEKHLAWIQSIADLDEKTLEHFFNLDSQQSQQFSSWSNGKFILHGSDWQLEHENEFQLNIAKECLSSLTGEKAYADRIPEVGSPLREILQSVAEIVGERTREFGVLTNQTSGFILSRYTILPVAKCDSPFWLLAQGPWLCCLIRTKELDKDHGNPSYNLVSFNISQDDFNFLKRRITETGIQYLTVTRVIFLGGTDDTTTSHRHFLMYQYEDWMHFESMGLFWLTEVSKVVKGYLHNRFQSSPWMNYKESLNGADMPCARRTRQWILQNGWDNVEIEGKPIDLKPWSNYILALCNEVLDDKNISDINNVSYELLKLVFKNEQQAKLLSEKGLSFIEKYDPVFIDRLVSFLFRSGHLPENESQMLSELNTVITELFGPLMQKTEETYDLINI